MGARSSRVNCRIAADDYNPSKCYLSGRSAPPGGDDFFVHEGRCFKSSMLV